MFIAIEGTSKKVNSLVMHLQEQLSPREDWITTSRGESDWKDPNYMPSTKSGLTKNWYLAGDKHFFSEHYYFPYAHPRFLMYEENVRKMPMPGLWVPCQTDWQREKLLTADLVFELSSKDDSEICQKINQNYEQMAQDHPNWLRGWDDEDHFAHTVISFSKALHQQLQI